MKIIIERGHAMATGSIKSAAAASAGAAVTTVVAAPAALAKTVTGTTARASKRVQAHTRCGRKNPAHVSARFPPAVSAIKTLVCLLLLAAMGSSARATRIANAAAAAAAATAADDRFDLTAADEAIARASLDHGATNGNHISGGYFSNAYTDGEGAASGTSGDTVEMQQQQQQQQQPQQHPLYYSSLSPVSMRPDRALATELAIESMGCKNLISYCTRELLPQYLSVPAKAREANHYQQQQQQQQQSRAGLDPVAALDYLELIDNELQRNRIKKASPKHTPRFGR